MQVLFGLFFMFSNFYQLDLHSKTHVALANRDETTAKTRLEIKLFMI
jgi:hypothetical protein